MRRRRSGTREGEEAGGSKKEEAGIERQPCQPSPKIATHHHSKCQARAALEVSSLLHKPRVLAMEGCLLGIAQG